MTPYSNPEFLEDQLNLLDLKLEALVRSHTAVARAQPFAGLTITAEEAEQALRDQPFSIPVGEADPSNNQRISQAENTLNGRLRATLESGVLPTLFRISQIFDLNEFEHSVLLMAIAPAWKARYRKLLGFLQDDLTATLPRIEFCLDLFCSSPADRAAGLSAFNPHRPLLGYQLLHLPSSSETPLPLRALRIDDYILNLVLGDQRSDPGIRDFAQWAFPKEGEPSHDQTDQDLVRLSALQNKNRIIHLYGPSGSGKWERARQIAFAQGRGLLTVEAARFETALSDTKAGAAAVFRQVLYFGGLLHIKGVEGEKNPFEGKAQALFTALRDHPLPAVITSDRPLVLESFPCERVLRIQQGNPDFPARCGLWQNALKAHPLQTASVEDLADRFSLAAGTIKKAVVLATQNAQLAGRNMESADLFAACRDLSATQMEDLAVKVEPIYGWDDIVLPRDTYGQLREICSQVTGRRQVYHHWKLKHKLAGGKGLVTLFAGPSGTGKTMAAEIMAAHLALDLFKIDLSAMVSKYIGETEKNLERLFRQAQGANAILFFDEADALFGKRGTQNDAHDRYANLEINYLLQRLETYNGLAILASNLIKNMDEAFVRRLRHIVHFPFPDIPRRRRIWQASFPAELPVADDVDYDFLANRFELSGGSIRNAAVNAAFYAADEGRLNMIHLVRAVKREYQKMGRMCLKSDFGSYFRYLEPAEAAAGPLEGALP